MPEPQSEIQHLSQNWQHQLAEAFNNIQDLCRYLHLSPDELPVSALAAKNFPLRVPLSFAACMEKGNAHDPLLRQVLPVKEELFDYPEFSNDPVGDLAAAAQTGVLHKYHGRVLFINTGSCAINCRYCFRRNFPYADLQLGKQKEDVAVRYIQDDASISEVILIGSDSKRRRPLAAKRRKTDPADSAIGQYSALEAYSNTQPAPNRSACPDNRRIH